LNIAVLDRPLYSNGGILSSTLIFRIGRIESTLANRRPIDQSMIIHTYICILVGFILYPSSLTQSTPRRSRATRSHASHIQAIGMRTPYCSSPYPARTPAGRRSPRLSSSPSPTPQAPCSTGRSPGVQLTASDPLQPPLPSLTYIRLQRRQLWHRRQGALRGWRQRYQVKDQQTRLHRGPPGESKSRPAIDSGLTSHTTLRTFGRAS
jgi:hypothetical protein